MPRSGIPFSEFEAKYPFLPESKRALSALGLTLDSFSDPVYKKIVERARERIIEALEKGERINYLKAPEDEVTELASYPLAVILVSQVGDKFLQRRFALAEAAVAQKRLLEEIERDNHELVIKIAEGAFGMKVELVEYPTRKVYLLGLKGYLESASKFNDPNWKLVNRVVERGRVLVEASEFIRLLRDKIEAHILNAVREAERSKLALPENLKKIVEEIRSIIPVRKVEEEKIKATARPDAWPPCIKTIYSKLLSGESVSHFANFALASFLINAGVPPEEVIAIYSRRSDFDSRIATYQVMHIAGRRGGGTKYIPPSCSKMKTNGLCIENGRLCGEVKNPLAYYKRALRRKKIDRSKNEEGGERS